VLSAAFKDEILKRFVNESMLRTLLSRTIEFLDQSATATSSLRIDRNILRGLQIDLFGPGVQGPPYVTSRAESPAIGSPELESPTKAEPDGDVRMVMDRTP
jgi:hypothetical protein